MDEGLVVMLKCHYGYLILLHLLAHHTKILITIQYRTID